MLLLNSHARYRSTQDLLLIRLVTSPFSRHSSAYILHQRHGMLQDELAWDHGLSNKSKLGFCSRMIVHYISFGFPLRGSPRNSVKLECAILSIWSFSCKIYCLLCLSGGIRAGFSDVHFTIFSNSNSHFNEIESLWDFIFWLIGGVQYFLFVIDLLTFFSGYMHCRNIETRFFFCYVLELWEYWNFGIHPWIDSLFIFGMIKVVNILNRLN